MRKVGKFFRKVYGHRLAYKGGKVKRKVGKFPENMGKVSEPLFAV
jgi:hypothetical protein